MIESCILWQKAADLANERGLEMTKQCPMVKTCTGEHCVFIDPVKKVEQLEPKKPNEVVIGCW